MIGYQGSAAWRRDMSPVGGKRWQEYRSLEAKARRELAAWELEHNGRQFPGPCVVAMLLGGWYVARPDYAAGTITVKAIGV